MFEKREEEDQNQITYYLPLDNLGRPKLALDQILQAEKNSIIHMELMNGLEITNKITLVTNAQENFPYELQERVISQKKLNKDDFSDFIFQPSEVSTSIVYEIKLERSGPVQFFFFYNDPKTDNEKNTLPFYITVLPKVVIRGKEIKLEDIQLQTILSKSLGKVNEFEKIFQEASRLKYNFVHFTPIQQLGASESLYCLRDNNKINNIFFDEKLSEDQKTKLIKAQLDKGRDIYGIGSFVDIVLNHTADNSGWIIKHPECGYNLENCPWLNCAYELDRLLQEYSNKFCDGKTSRKFQPFINDENELNEVIEDIWEIVNKANLIEYFMMDFEENKKILTKFYEKYYRERSKYTRHISSLHISNDNDAIEYIFNNCLDDVGSSRNGVKINGKKFGCCLIKLFNYNVNNRNLFYRKAEEFMQQCNEKWKNLVPTWIESGINNIRGGMYWEFVHNHAKAERDKRPLITPYFAVFDKKDKSKIFACNGWLVENDDPNNPSPDFGAKGNYFYFKRNINIWSDCLKLNYGQSPSDCPYLIGHMTKYVQQMAKMFNGIKFDNAQSVPIYAIEYLAQKAREVNPNIIIMAKLSTRKDIEVDYVNRVGINLLIRELIWCNEVRSLFAQLRRYGGGKTEENKIDYVKKDDDICLKNMKCLLPSLPRSIIFDLAHDSETYLQKMNNLALNLTNMACNSFNSSAIGSTRGFDQLFPVQPSVVNENRKYNYDEEFNNMFPGEELKLASPKKVEKKEEPKEVSVKFDYRCKAGKVQLALSCRGWQPDINLEKVGDDLFSTEVVLKNNQKILYKFVIDGKNWVCDDTKPKEDDGKGNVNNVIALGSKFQSKSGDDSDSFGNNSQKEFHSKDLKLLRRQLNSIRNDMSLYKNDFSLKQENQFLSIFRTFIPEENYLENTPNYDGYALICRTGYDQGATNPTKIELPGIYSEFICGSTMGLGKVDIAGFQTREDLYGTDSDVYFTRDGKWLNGFSYTSQDKGKTIININGNMPCNSAVVLKYRIIDGARNALFNIEKDLNEMYDDWKNLTKDVDLCDINLVLYKCEKEELDNTNKKRGTYAFEKFGPLCYAGISHLRKKLNEYKITKESNAIIENIKTGDWLLNYEIERYKDQPNLSKIYNILTSIYGNYTKLYVDQKPTYITKIINTIYNIMILKLYDLMKNKDFINLGPFTRLLLEAVPQFNGYIESSRFKHNTEYPYNKLSLSAGLPDYSTEYMRCWGRDTFISFKGLFLIPGLFDEAKSILINYASVMRHGLIPNLLDSGVNCRYNARDATWFFLKSVIDYVEMSNDYDILNTDINMVFLSDDFNENNDLKNKGEKRTMKLSEIIHDILQRHAMGINFKEWRAGKDIDQQMTDEGFNIKIYLNEENGFVYGGNKWNCGTWMDRIGSSDKAKNKGHPATPRNGADCEIIGLLYFTLTHLASLNKKGKYPFNEIKLNTGKKLKYSEWAKKIKKNFESNFFIEKKNDNTSHVNIYKDYLSDDNDFVHEAQLRCNIFVTLAVAPELFYKKHAINFMKVAEQYLIVNNSIGVRTLDFSDQDYNGNYDVKNDSDNFKVARGFNLHNGPEWVWPFGFYLISKMIFNDAGDGILIDLCKKLMPFINYILKDKWSGLPELTNKDGALCEASCPTQAKSIATLIEALDEMGHKYNLLNKQPSTEKKKKKKAKKVPENEIEVQKEVEEENENENEDEEPMKIKYDEDNENKDEENENKNEDNEIRNEENDNENDNNNDNENENEESKKELKKKKKIVKKVKKIKKHKDKDKDKEEQKEEPIVIIEKLDNDETQDNGDESKEKKTKKVKKIIRKIKKIKKKGSESREESRDDILSISKPEQENEQEPEVKEEIIYKIVEGEGHVKKKKKIIRKIKRVKKKNINEEGVPVVNVNEESKEHKEKRKKSVKKKKIVKKKKKKQKK